jgi:hypothetical protein
MYLHVSLECWHCTPTECISSDSLVTNPGLPSLLHTVTAVVWFGL